MIDNELNLGSEVLLPSHGYPAQYPSNAYVLWTFLCTQVDTSTNLIAYTITFGYIDIGSEDTLIVGRGWSPDIQTNQRLIVSYGPSYSGYPFVAFCYDEMMYIEFEADDRYEAGGFQLDVGVRDRSGMIILKYKNERR